MLGDASALRCTVVATGRVGTGEEEEELGIGTAEATLGIVTES